ncbi:hypothetical protein [Roseisolibacter sp. H3M3-2]|uniref:hypothetical protein n=1 Tax=Roseisolibacter sp. H3M3-2 TaxID=3031323 RepID=UPI0023DB8413|nr:hypothetical protein [Roseisolibacter sp. H3M3-2]MDF1504702.1 hypothetical protein [Roseisolibacter sp. H3M3-2]
MQDPAYDLDPDRPPHERPHAWGDDAGYEAPHRAQHARRRTGQRGLIAALGALLLVLLVAGVWYGDDTNRARRELSAANARIADKQQEVDDARRLLERRLAELRAVRAEADVQATVYRGVLEREGRPVVADSAAVGGEVMLPPQAPAPAAQP